MPVSSVLHILRTIKDRGSISRTDLQQLTGLSWGTVTNTTRQLLDRKLVREDGAHSNKAGRKPMSLALFPAGHGLVGIDIGPAAIRCLAANLAADILFEEILPLGAEDEPAAILARVTDLVRRAQSAADGREIFGVGIALSGRLDAAHTQICAPGMPRWNNVPIRTVLESHLHLPVCLQHHSAALALAESWFGAASADDLLCIDLGESVNLGILIDGEVFRGGAGIAASLAHVSLDPNGPPCSCGNHGCVDTYCAAPGVLAFARQSANPSGANAHATSIEELTVLAAAGNDSARAAFDRMGHHLALGINTLIQLFDPALIVLTGTSTVAADFFQPALMRQLATHVPCGKLLLSRLGSRAAALGACVAVLQSTFPSAQPAPNFR